MSLRNEEATGTAECIRTMCHTLMWQGQDSLFPIPHDLEGKLVWIGMPYLDSSTDHWSLTEAPHLTYIVENLHRKELGTGVFWERMPYGQDCLVKVS